MKWEVSLCCDKTIQSGRDRAEVLFKGVLSPGMGDVGFGPSPNALCEAQVLGLGFCPSLCNDRYP